MLLFKVRKGNDWMATRNKTLISIMPFIWGSLGVQNNLLHLSINSVPWNSVVIPGSIFKF